MEDALTRIAALAPTLKEAELRCLLQLTTIQQEGKARISSRDLARATNLARPNVQLAIDSLTERSLIASDGGTATRASTYQLLFLDTAVLPERGIASMPPNSKIHPEGGIVTKPQVALFQCQGGIVTEPEGGIAVRPHPRARLAPGSESDSDWERRIRATSDLFERIAKAKPEGYDSDEIRTVRDALCGYWRRMKEDPDAHPPPDKLCAEMLAIAPRRRILQLIDDLWKGRQKPDRSYRWFIVVALNRIHNLEPANIGKGFAQLRMIEKHVPDPEQRALLPDEERERIIGLHEAMKLAAAGKAFR